ncbi:MAG: hypothetical protein ACREDT_00260 [Methylocella sp.]
MINQIPLIVVTEGAIFMTPATRALMPALLPEGGMPIELCAAEELAELDAACFTNLPAE